jgi:hypothetical protein
MARLDRAIHALREKAWMAAFAAMTVECAD